MVMTVMKLAPQSIWNGPLVSKLRASEMLTRPVLFKISLALRVLSEGWAVVFRLVTFHYFTWFTGPEIPTVIDTAPSVDYCADRRFYFIFSISYTCTRLTRLKQS